ncbi:MAG TPA: hypothetical protein VI078_13715 [bacterium]
MDRTARGFRPVLLLSLSAGLIVIAAARPAGAVPIFARKYQTSCQTCHVIFPKLNAHGEAFRLNGYRMPAGHEKEEPVKEKPVALGAEADKRLWPAAVYPTDIPGTVPLAVNVKLATVLTSGPGGRRTSFEFPQEVNLFTAGTLGDAFSFFGEVTYAERPDSGSDVEIEHAQLQVNSPFGPEHLVNFKIGKFAPDLDAGVQEMWLMTDNGIGTIFSYNPIGFHGGTGLSDKGGISLPANVKGIEIYGVAAHRLFYTIGACNGMGPGATGETADGNNRRDYYARVDYKFGGMGLDGSESGGEGGEMAGMAGMAGTADMPAMSGEAHASKNWRESSLRVGLLGYTGDGSKIDFAVADASGNPFTMQDRRYNRIGLFASWYFRDLNVFGVALHGTDRLRLLDSQTSARIDETTRGYDAWFAQADYVLTPALQGSVRYENLDAADSHADTLQFLNLNLSVLVRANIKVMLEYRADLGDTQDYSVAGVVRFAI